METRLCEVEKHFLHHLDTTAEISYTLDPRSRHSRLGVTHYHCVAYDRIRPPSCKKFTLETRVRAVALRRMKQYEQEGFVPWKPVVKVPTQAEAVDALLRESESRGLRPATLKTYRNVLGGSQERPEPEPTSIRSTARPYAASASEAEPRTGSRPRARQQEMEPFPKALSGID